MHQKVIIIAEAGVNHNGDLNNALLLIEAAAEAGADYVKFQTFKTEKLVQKDAQKAAYQIKNTKSADSQFEMLKKLEIPVTWYSTLIEHCEKNDIGFLSTGFDEESIDFLDEIGCALFKIPSGEITNLPYLKHIASKGKPIVMSTGMADMQEVKDAFLLLMNEGVSSKEITILHCNTQYPTKMSDVNLKAMNFIGDQLGVQIGYSDHTLGIEVAIAAVAMGASLIEKHFTLDKEMEGPDHAASLTPLELKAMISGIRNVEMAMQGSGVKEPSNSEKANKIAARKSIHYRNDLLEGVKLKIDDLIMLRPGDGISPMQLEQVIGKRLNTNVSAGTKLDWKHLI